MAGGLDGGGRSSMSALRAGARPAKVVRSGRGPSEIALRAGESTSGIRRGRRLVCCASSTTSFRIWGAPSLGDRPDGRGPPSPPAGASPGRGLHLFDRATREGCPLQPLANGPVVGSGCVGSCGRGPRSQAAGLGVGCCKSNVCLDGGGVRGWDGRWASERAGAVVTRGVTARSVKWASTWGSAPDWSLRSRLLASIVGVPSRWTIGRGDSDRVT